MREKKKRSIKFRLISRIALLIIGIFVLISLAFDICISEYMENNAAQVLTESREYAARRPEAPDPRELQRPGTVPAGRAEAVIVTADYDVLVPESVFGNLKDNSNLLDFAGRLQELKVDLAGAEIEKLTTDSGVYYYTAAAAGDMKNSYIVFFINMTELNRFKLSLSRILWAVMLIALIVTLGSMYIIGGRIAKPIKSLSDFARKIGEGEYGTVAAEYEDSELHELKESMNEASRKLAEFDREQRVFFQNVSHELRTPLQIIKTNAEGIEVGVVDKDNAVDIIKDETDRLSELVEDIIYLSRLEARSNDMDYTKNDLRETLAYTLERYRNLFQRKNIEVVYDFDDRPVMFTYDEKSIERAFQNLISNALRYTKDKIIVRCHWSESRIMVAVEDNGPGISAETQAKIFDRFYKGEKGQHGIGLSIVKSIVNSYGGRAEVESGPEGTRFTLFF